MVAAALGQQLRFSGFFLHGLPLPWHSLASKGPYRHRIDIYVPVYTGIHIFIYISVYICTYIHTASALGILWGLAPGHTRIRTRGRTSPLHKMTVDAQVPYIKWPYRLPVPPPRVPPPRVPPPTDPKLTRNPSSVWLNGTTKEKKNNNTLYFC